MKTQNDNFSSSLSVTRKEEANLPTISPGDCLTKEKSLVFLVHW
jgi:hypothetical protein